MNEERTGKCGLEMTFKCTQCEKAFETERGLKTHMTRTHKTKQGVTSENSQKHSSLKQDSDQDKSPTISTASRSVERSVEIDSVTSVGMSMENYGGNSTEIDSTSIITKDSSRNDVEKPEAVYGVSYDRDCQKTCTCTQCGRAFGTERGLKTHMSRTHKTKQGVTSENSQKQSSLKQDSDQDKSPTISTPSRSLERSVEIDSVTSVGMSMENYGGNSTGIDSTSIVTKDSSRNDVEKPETAYDVSYDRDCQKTCICTQCGRAFGTERGLKTHMSRTHKTKQDVTSESSQKQASLNQDKSPTISTPPRSVERSVEIDSVTSVGMSMENYGGNSTGIDSTSIVAKNSSRNDVEKSEAADDMSYDRDCQKTCTCTQCGRAFGTERGLKTHMSRTHKTKQDVTSESSQKQASLKQDSDQDKSPTISTPSRSVERSVEIDSVTSVGMSMENYGGNSTEIDSTSIVKKDSSRNDVEKPEAADGVSYDRDCQKTCTCTQCGRAFGTERGLKIHMSRTHKTKQGVTSENSQKQASLKQDSDQDKSPTISTPSRSVERSVEIDSVTSVGMSMENYGGNSTEIDSTSIVKKDSSRNDVEKSEAADGVSYDQELPDVGDLCQLPKKGIKNHERNESLSTNVSAPPTYHTKKELSDVSDPCQRPNERVSTSVSAPPSYTTKKGPGRKLLKQLSSNKLYKEDIQETARVMNELMDKFMKELKEISPTFGWNQFKSGSYYDKTKNSLPDEFDIMIYPNNLQVQVDFESNIQVPGFYKVKLVSPRCEEINSMVDDDGYIMPAGFKHYVFGLFDEVRSKIRQGRRMKKKETSNDDSPAYTFDYEAIPNRRIDVDLVPCFRISGWPPIAKKIDPKWLSQNKVVNDAVKCYDIVCKTFPEDVTDRDYLWRLSFSYAEKKLITGANDGNKCSNKKKAFKMIKNYIEEIKMKHPDKVKKCCSYHIKQFMLQQFDTWQEGEIGSILKRLVSVLIDNLSSSPPHIDNYFIENDNVIRFVPDSEIQLIVQGLRETIH